MPLPVFSLASSSTPFRFVSPKRCTHLPLRYVLPVTRPETLTPHRRLPALTLLRRTRRARPLLTIPNQLRLAPLLRHYHMALLRMIRRPLRLVKALQPQTLHRRPRTLVRHALSISHDVHPPFARFFEM